MLSTRGSIFIVFSFWARSTSVLTYSFSSGVADAAVMCGLPPSISGRGKCSMSAVCTSANVRNIESSSGRLTNFAKRVCIR
jgi:hypothetical protein